MTLNIIVTFIVVLITMGVLVALTLPDIPVVRVVLVLVGVAVTVPIVLFPFCNLAWFAVDLRAHPPSAGELGEASAAISEKSATHP